MRESTHCRIAESEAGMDGAAASSSRTHVAAESPRPHPEPLRPNQQAVTIMAPPEPIGPGRVRPWGAGLRMGWAQHYYPSRWSGT
jgi:hypothetical protein